MKFIAGCLCLDFVNTVGARIRQPGRRRARDYADFVLRDKLATYGELAEWARLAGVLTGREARALARHAASHPREAAAALTRAAALREALYRIFKCAVEQWRPDQADVGILNSELSIARAHQRLITSGGAFSRSVFSRGWESLPEALDRALWPVAESAADLLTSADSLLVGQCPGTECGWMFLDTSRNRQRQWCDMKECGNRAKIKRFRERRGMP